MKVLKKFVFFINFLFFLFLFFKLSISTIQETFFLDFDEAKFNFTQNLFNDSSPYKVLTFSGIENKTVYLTIPKNSTVFYSNISLEGFMRPIQSVAGGGSSENVYDVAVKNVNYSLPFDEIVVGTNNPAVVRVLNNTGGVVWSYTMSTSVYSVAVGNLSSDIGNEIVAGDVLNLCMINSSGVQKWCKNFGNPIYDIEIKNVLSQEYEEIAASIGQKIYLLNSSGEELWNFNSNSTCNGVGIGNISADDGEEIVGACGSYVYCLNSSGGLIWSVNLGVNINDVDVGDLDANEYEEIVVSGINGSVFALNAQGNVLWKFEISESVDAVKIWEVTDSQYVGNEVVVGSVDDYVYVLSSSGSLIWKFKTEADVGGVGIGNLSTTEGNEVVVGTSASDYNLYILNFEYYPENPWLDIGNDYILDWSFSGKFRTKNYTSNNSAFQDFLFVCSPDSTGNCNIPLVVHSDFSGNMNLSLIVRFQYDASNIFSYSIIQEWSRTNDVKVNESVGNEIKNISYTRNPALDILVKYIKINQDATICDFNGQRYSVTEINGVKACDISTLSYTIPSSGNLPIGKLWDSSMSSDIPIRMNESSYVIHSGYLKKNITIWNETQTIFTNVIANTTISSSQLVQNALTYIKVEWYDNGTLYDITPSYPSNNCNTETPTYTQKIVGNDTFFVCKQDVDNDGIYEFFSWKQPHTNKTFTRYEIWGSANYLPEINLVEISPSYGKWGSEFNITLNITDEEENNITVLVCLNLTKTFNISSINFSSLIFDCNWEKNVSSGQNVTWNFTSEKEWAGFNLIKFRYRDFNDSTNEFYHEFFDSNILYGPNVTKHDVTVTLIEGNESKVNRTEEVILIIQVNDTDLEEPINEANCSFWVSFNESLWDFGHAAKSNSSGHCSYSFSPNSLYSPGLRWWKAGIFNDLYYTETNSTNFTIEIYGKLNINLTSKSFSQNLTRSSERIFEALIFDEFKNIVRLEGYNCSWYINETYQNKTSTNSSGYCKFNLNTNCSNELGVYGINVTLSGDITPYYIFNKTSDSKNISLKDNLNLTIVSPLQGSIYHPGQIIYLNSTIKDYCNATPTHKYNISWYIEGVNPDITWPPNETLYGENVTLDISNYPPGMLKINLSAIGEFYNQAYKNTSSWIYRWSSLKMFLPDTEIYEKTEERRSLNISCFVFDANITTNGIGKYPISVLNNSFLVVSDFTSSIKNATGWFNYTWNISDLPDGNYTITCNISRNYTENYFNYDAVKLNESVWTIIREKDTKPPEIINISVNSTTPGKNVTIEALIRDWYGVNSSWINLTYPNSTSKIFYLQNTTPNRIFTTWRIVLSNLDQIGDYDFVLYANDSSATSLSDPNHTSSKNGWFCIHEKINSTYSVESIYDGGFSDIELNFYRNGTNHLMYKIKINSSSGNVVNEIFKRSYDIIANIDAFLGSRSSKNNRIKFLNSDLLRNESFFFEADYFDTSWIDIPRLGFLGIKGFIARTNLTFSAFDVIINYSEEFPIYRNNIYFSETGLKIWKCSDWNRSIQACESGWKSYAGNVDFLNHIITTNFTNFSAFVVGNEVQLPSGGGGVGGGTGGGGAPTYAAFCGNNVCDPGETTENCPQDCKQASLFTLRTNLTEAYLSPGDERKYGIWLKSLSTKELNINISISEEIKNFIKTEEKLKLQPNEEKLLILEVFVPQDADAGRYGGEIVVSGNGAKEKLPVSLVISEKLPVKLDVVIEALEKKLAQNQTGRFKVTLYNLGIVKTFFVELSYIIKNIETGEIIFNETSKKEIHSSESFIKDVLIPFNASIGKYSISLIARYEGKESRSSDTFEVVKTTYIPLREITILTLTSLSIVGIVESRKRYFKWKAARARYIFPVDIKSLPKGNLWLGKVAESDIKQTFDMNDLTTHVLIAGATGSGKSVTGNIFVEELLDQKIAVVVFDPTGQWSGFVRPCTDPKVLRYYRKHGLSQRDAKFYPGNILEITDPNEKIDLRKYMRGGEVTIFMLTKLKPGDYDVAITNIVNGIFEQGWEESTELKLVVVFDEVHRLLERYGGKGGYIALERACREFRKWGIGLIMISQVLSDFKEAIKGNVLTEIQMHTKSASDLLRIEKKYGLEYAKRVAREEIGIGMIQNPKYNKGIPWFVSFRPPLHMPHKLPAEELKKYKEYNAEIEKIELEIDKLKRSGIDVSDLEIDLKLAVEKLKHGMFRMAEIYLESLKKKLRK